MNKQSKFLSLILRHKPEIINLNIDKNGWAYVDELIVKSNLHNNKLSLEILKDIVKLNDKKRFEFSEDGLKIRALQGHSIKVDLQLKSVRPPRVLYHGTSPSNIEGIKKKGILKMNRHAVHLSESLQLAIIVGKRKIGISHSVIVLEINSLEMYNDGFKFFKTSNDVWLTDKIDPKYIKNFKEII
jgi:putative RNA 2'-phosphotransferase